MALDTRKAAVAGSSPDLALLKNLVIVIVACELQVEGVLRRAADELLALQEERRVGGRALLHAPLACYDCSMISGHRQYILCRFVLSIALLLNDCVLDLGFRV
jgi:hypothetical protein